MNRPTPQQFEDPESYIKGMIHFQKQINSEFSIHALSKNLRRISPTLVSLIIKKKRKLTLDRIDEMSKLLGLTIAEKHQLKNWITHREKTPDNTEPQEVTPKNLKHKEVSEHILSDWLNVYVKDCFQIPAVQTNPKLLNSYLSHLASPNRIERSLRFLLKQGHLRRTLDSKIVVDTPLTITEPKAPNLAVRKFHKAALDVAKRGLDSFSIEERVANTFVVPLNEKNQKELRNLISDFSEQLKIFLSENVQDGERLYQITINLSPTGGKVE